MIDRTNNTWRLLCLLTIALGTLLMCVVPTFAAPNPTINYQGKLTDSTGLAVPDGTYNMRFYLYDDLNVGTTSAIWTETLTGSNKVQVTNGLFSVMLGSTTSFASQNIDFDQALYLGVEIGGSTTLQWDGEMSPRKILGTVPAAFVAYDALDSVALGGVASTSFLRSDQADTASGLLTFTGGLISNSSSTITDLSFVTATGTTLVINGDRITDFTGAGLAMDGTSLTVATGTLNINFSDMIGTVAVSQGGTGSTTPSGFLFGDGAGNLASVYSISPSYIEDVFLRNDGDDTTTGRLTINGGLLSLASSTIGNGTGAGGLTISGNATTTGNLIVQGSANITTNDEQGYDLFSVVGSTTATATVITQLGSGDIFALANTNGDVFRVDNGGDVGIGTTSPTARLSVSGDTWLDSNVISFGSSTASSLLLRYFTEATSTIKQGSAYAFTLATSTSAEPIFRVDTSGSYANSLFTGSFGVNNGAIAYDAVSNQTSIERLQLGNVKFEDDAGTVSWIDLGVTATSAAGAIMSYSAQIDNTALLTLYAEADGSGGIENAGVGIGTTSPWARLSVLGDATDATKPLFSIASSTGTSLFHVSSGGNVGIGTTSSWARLSVSGNAVEATKPLLNIASSTGASLFHVSSIGNVGLGTTSPLNARLTIDRRGVSGATKLGMEQYLLTANTVESATQYGNYVYFDAANNTATTTIVGTMIRIDDDTSYGNTVRGLEVQADRGVNTEGENTALSGIARTFGVRGVTRGNAGGTYEPAGGFFETEGNTSGNAIRGYSDTITTATLMSLFQTDSDFDGTGLEMNFGNGGTGSFSSTTSRFLDLQVAGTSVFTVTAYGTTTIGDGVRQAGLQIVKGGLCVDTNGCSASTTGRISAVEYHTGNSDLAEVYFSSTELEPGELVSFVGGLSVDRASREQSSSVIGVVSTKPGLTLGADDSPLEEGETGYPIALTGRVPIKLSTENGPIKAGDQLMLSSLPGVAMKATSTGAIVGIALEDFDDDRMYSDAYVNQFGDDMVDPVYEPILTNLDPRISDGCYYGGGSDVGDPLCVPLESDTELGRIEEANRLAEGESVEEALAALRSKKSERITLDGGETVRVGQIVMFVERQYRWLDDQTAGALDMLMSPENVNQTGSRPEETLFDRLIQLANSFIDGVLSVFELKADRVEITQELCVDGVCVTADDLRDLMDRPVPIDSGVAGDAIDTGAERDPQSGVTDLIEEEEIGETTGVADASDDEAEETGGTTIGDEGVTDEAAGGLGVSETAAEIDVENGVVSEKTDESVNPQTAEESRPQNENGGGDPSMAVSTPIEQS